MLCEICQGISLEEMQGPGRDRMQRHQPSYLALKYSMTRGCQLCGFIWTALEQYVSFDKELGADALKHVSEAYPGREISLVCWGDPRSFVDRIHIITSGDVPYVSSDIESDGGAEDPTMHPDYQYALSGVLGIFAYPGKFSS